MKKILKNLITIAMCLFVFIGSNYVLAYTPLLDDVEYGSQKIVNLPISNNDMGIIKLMSDPKPMPY